MNVPKKAVQASLFVAAAGLLAVVARMLAGKRLVANLTTQQIEDTIEALDPIARAAVIARLTADAAGHVKDHLPGQQ